MEKINLNENPQMKGDYMAFNTLVFILFFIFVLIGSFVIPAKWKWLFLLVSSYFFYCYASVKFLIFILLTTLTSYFATLYMGKQYEIEKSEGSTKEIKRACYLKRKKVLILTLVLNFGILLFLKYFNFFSDNLNHLFSSLSLNSQIPRLNLLLPLGISFYTFQTMSYVIDVYWGKIKPERNLAKVALFVSFFPQILQGPIGRFKDLAPQLYQPKKASYHDLKFGLQLMLWGYFKKMVIADRTAIIANYVFENYLNISGAGVVLGVFMYAIQDYCDFSGCIDIARGCAQSMGITMAENFRRPYFSKTVSEFWRRWHMSLGTWMKDYVFYPFSLTNGVRKISKFAKKHFGKHIGRTLPIALGNLLVFFLVGVWHGANWNYIIWGIFYGLLIAISGMLKPVFSFLNQKLHIPVKSKSFQLFQILRTFWITCIGCIIFRATTLANAWDIFIKTFHFYDFPIEIKKELLSFGLNGKNYIVLFVALIVLFIVDILQERMSVRDYIAKKPICLRWGIYVLALIVILLLGMYGPGYDQNQFVYMQF